MVKKLDKDLIGFDIDQITPEEEKVFGDIYDLYAEVINIHSQIKEINADFTISNLSEHEITFIRDQLKIVIIVNEFLLGKETKLRASRLLMRDVYSLAIMSRAREGKVLNAVLSYGRSREEAEEMNKASLIQKLFGSGRKDNAK